MKIRDCIDIVNEASKKRRAKVSHYALVLWLDEDRQQSIRFDVWEDRTPRQRREMVRELVEPHPGGLVVFQKIYTEEEAERRDYRDGDRDRIDQWHLPDRTDQAGMDDCIDEICRAVEQELKSKQAKADRKAVHPAHQPKAVRKALKNICGEILGWGISRKVYAHKKNKDLVVKVFRPADPYQTGSDPEQNKEEWWFWQQAAADPQLAKWFAPCIELSKDGRVLIQRRTKPATAADLAGIKVPAFIGEFDHHLKNWGILDGRPVLCDYGFGKEGWPLPAGLLGKPEMRRLVPVSITAGGRVAIG